jgi:hypothetical protein
MPNRTVPEPGRFRRAGSAFAIEGEGTLSEAEKRALLPELIQVNRALSEGGLTQEDAQEQVRQALHRLRGG